jgi:hypothetical protein
MARSKDNDEAYIVDICDEILGLKARRQHRFDFLCGDPGKSGRQVRLPVDAYYPELCLVVEYHERQHTESVSIFNRMTISGMTRDEQRKRYDQRRAEVLPQHGITLVVLCHLQFDCNNAKRLRRVPGDRIVIEQRLARTGLLTRRPANSLFSGASL